MEGGPQSKSQGLPATARSGPFPEINERISMSEFKIANLHRDLDDLKNYLPYSGRSKLNIFSNQIVRKKN